MRLYVPLTLDEAEQLREIARAERRRVQDQAGFLLAQALAAAAARRAGDRPADDETNALAPTHAGARP
jgi:hypothetical protein